MAISPVAMAWITAISAAVSVASMAMALSARGKGAGDFQDQGLAISRRGQDNPSIVPFGSCIVPAARVWTNVNNNNQKWMVQNFSLGHGPFEAIQQIYIDEQPLFNVEDTDKSEQWFNNVHFKPGFENVQLGVRRGLPTSATWQKIIDNGDGQWTKDHRGDGIGTLSFLLERPDMKGKSDNPYRIMSNNFAVTALVKGVAVIDPRISLEGWNDKSKRVYGNSSRNPACCLLTYLADNEWGFGARMDMVDLASFVLLANWCDQNKITLDGYVDQSQTYGKILDAFTSSFGGSIFLQNGMITVLPDTISPVFFNVKEEDLVDSINVSNNAADYFNTIKVDFQNSETRYCKDTFVLPVDAKADETILADGRVFEDTIDCPMSTNPAYIKMFANRELKRAKLCRKSINLSLTNTQFDLKMGRVFTVTNSLYKLDTKTKWRITKLESSLDKNVLITKVSAEEYNDLVYDTTAYDDGIISGNLPRPDFTILPVTNLKFVQNNTLTVGSGVLSWDGQYYGDRRFIVQYKLSAETEWTQYGEYPYESIMIQGLQAGVNYDFRVQTVASIGGSVWTRINNQRVNRSITLPAPKNLTADFTSPDCLITWDAITGAISNTSVVGDGINNLSQLIGYYEVVINNRSYRSTTPNFTYSFEENGKNGLTRDLNISVKAISLYGDVGLQSAIVARNNPMAQPSGVAVRSQLTSLTVTWDNPSEPALGILDYSSSDIYLVPTQQTVASDQYLLATSNTGSFTKLMPDNQKTGWIRIAHRDVFGHTSPITASPALYYSQTTIDNLITDSEFEGNFKELEDNVNKIDGELTELGKEVDSNKAEVDSDLVNQQNQINAEKDRLNGTISDLAETEADLNVAKANILKNATDIKTNKTEITSQGARLTTVEQVASDNTGSIASVSQRVEAVNKDLIAKVETNKQSIVTTNAALASMDTRLSADIGKNTASIVQTNKTVATLNSTVSSMDTRLTAVVNKNTADIKTTQETVADLNGSMSTINTELSAKIDKNTSNITANKTAIAATDKNLADYKLTVSTEFGKTNGRIDTVSSSVSTLEKTVATQGTTIQANYNDLNGKITTNSTAIVNANKAITSLDTKLTAQIKGVDDKANGIKATVDQQAIAIAATDKSLTELKTSTTAQFGTVNSRIDTVQTNLATTDKAITSLDTKLQAQINTNKAGIASNKTAIATTDSSLSSYKTSNNAEVAGVKASVTTISQAQASTDGKVSAMYGLKVDANGKVAGMTLAATPKGSTVDFLADTFRIASATNGTPVTAFETRGGKVMIRSLLVSDITASQISADAINGNHIASNSIIVAGSGATSATLNGSDPTWRIYAGSTTPASAPFRVSGAGALTATGANVTGTLNATGGNFTGPVSISNRLNMTGGFLDGRSGQDSLNFNSGRTRIDSNGTFHCVNAVIRGTLQVADIVGDITEVFVGTGQTLSIGSSPRARNIIQVIDKFVCSCTVSAGPGTLGVKFQALLNGIVIGESPVTASTTNGTNSYPLNVYLRDVVGVCPANVTGTITFRVIAYNSNTLSISNVSFSGQHGWLTAIK